MSTELRISTDPLSDFRSHSQQRQNISHSRESILNQHNPRMARSVLVFNVNINENLRFDMRKNNRGTTTAEEDDMKIMSTKRIVIEA